MLPEEAAAMTAAGAPRFSVLVRIECQSEVVRAWAGFGDLAIPADEVEAEGGTYLGLGLLSEIPALRQLIGGAAERLDFNLAVPTGELFDLADQDAAEVKNAPVNMALVFFDAGWQLSGEPVWLWDGTADVPSVNRPAGANTRAISLSVGSSFTDRTRPQLTYFTDADQRRRSPDDRFCERVASYTGTSTIKWPD